jgi:riboflavin synthase
VFTGIVKYIGQVADVEASASGIRLRVRCAVAAERLAVDDSISVAGVCLTVIARDADGFDLDVVPETLSRTTLGLARPGSSVNLELAVTMDTALGGHLVQGHVDGTALLVARNAIGGGAELTFQLPPELARYIVPKGFIAVDGVSLTVASVAAGAFEVALIPHTAQRTTLGALLPGAEVNLEVDVLAKYVERLLQARG